MNVTRKTLELVQAAGLRVLAIEDRRPPPGS
jgi:hypothetical protein